MLCMATKMTPTTSFHPELGRMKSRNFLKFWRKGGEKMEEENQRPLLKWRKYFPVVKVLLNLAGLAEMHQGKICSVKIWKIFDFSYSVMPQMSVANMNFDGIHLLDNGDNHSALDRRSAFGSLPKRSSVTSSLTKRGSNFTSSFAKCDSTSTKQS